MDYPTILPSGIHDMSIAETKSVFVDSFPDPEHRALLWKRFLKLLSLLRKFEIDLEIWIDGSFVTEKPSPSDIDILVLGNQDEVDGLSLAQKKRFESIFRDKTGIRDMFLCDIYFSVADHERSRSYWRGWFCFDRSEQPKGLCRIRIPDDSQ